MVEIIGGQDLKYMTEGSAGMDLVARQATASDPWASLTTSEDAWVFAGQSRLFGTGVSVNMSKSPGLFAMVHVRSSLGAKGIVLANSTGIIDNDYQGEIMVLLRNLSRIDVKIALGSRIAQLVFQKYERPDLVHVTSFSAATVRGEGGFGSTGE